MSKGRISRFEQQIEQLVEGSFARLFAGRLQPREVATHLARAIEDKAQSVPDGNIIAPNVYVIHLNPEDHEALLAAQPDLARSLTGTVIELANRVEMRLLTQPVVEFVPDGEVPLRQVLVDADHVLDAEHSTQVYQPVKPPQPEHMPRNPHLIIGGTQDIALDRRVINIGRRHDNHIVLDDMRVSRHHCQLRLRFGHYVLYDLGSSGGTLVNNHAITECILKPGDVISLAGVALVYIEDESTTNAARSTIVDTQIRPPRLDPSDQESDDPTI